MAKEDWAIVVGIKNYFDPNLSGLEGPENDAMEFYDWVVSDDGGAVPKGQAKLILSSDYNPPFTSAAAAMPTAEAIKFAFDHLRSIADENEAKGVGREVGRRLYLFFAGHGFAPANRDDLTALLTAEASIANAQLSHILGSYMADFFWRAKFFEEILLFMDCCRSVMECAQLYMPYDDERATDFYKVRRFYAYGARVAKESREWKMADGKFHGVFTTTLLNALEGTAYDPHDPSKITAESLRDQLYNGFKSFMSDDDRQRPDLPKEPEVEYEQKPGANFTIVVRANLAQRILGLTKTPRCVVTIYASSAVAGTKATIRDKDLNVVSEETLANETKVSLERGFYAIDITGAAEPIAFEVNVGTKEIHV
jgi:hypothetical protein